MTCRTLQEEVLVRKMMLRPIDVKGRSRDYLSYRSYTEWNWLSVSGERGGILV